MQQKIKKRMDELSPLAQVVLVIGILVLLVFIENNHDATLNVVITLQALREVYNALK